MDRRHRDNERGRHDHHNRAKEEHDPVGGFNVYPRAIEEAIYAASAARRRVAGIGATILSRQAAPALVEIKPDCGWNA